MADHPEDFYALLGVSRTATEDELKKAYRARARELHPDANPGDPEAENRFKLVTVAYETLRDPERRRRYDLLGPEGMRGAGAPGSAGFDDIFGANLGDIFQSFFGGGSPFGAGGRRQAGPPRGNDVETAIQLDFEEAVFGVSHEVRLRLPVTCETCSGSGAKPGSGPVTCSQCEGTGEVRRTRQSILGQMITSSPCPRCGGVGQMITSPCPDCRGDGRRTEERTYTVDVPAGVDDGSTLKVTGRGAAGPRGGPPGDLYVHLRVRADERFVRQGNDLVHVLHVPMAQAALGAVIHYETLDGVEDLVIPKGTQPGRVFRLRSRGVPRVNGGGARGDLLVQVVVDTPTDLSKEQEDLLRLLATARGEEVAPPDTGFLARVRSAFK
ncbi:MAG: molecular chaperone DnaJ [Actinomycetota bacterium]|nr:molecular chaperone DnaJ [Actinomycetota bacterium]MEA2972674.1 molecular chaperone DnaJ [Actinomycetota bacterium]